MLQLSQHVLKEVQRPGRLLQGHNGSQERSRCQRRSSVNSLGQRRSCIQPTHLWNLRDFIHQGIEKLSPLGKLFQAQDGVLPSSQGQGILQPTSERIRDHQAPSFQEGRVTGQRVKQSLGSWSRPGISFLGSWQRSQEAHSSSSAQQLHLLRWTRVPGGARRGGYEGSWDFYLFQVALLAIVNSGSCESHFSESSKGTSPQNLIKTEPFSTSIIRNTQFMQVIRLPNYKPMFLCIRLPPPDCSFSVVC